MLFRSQVNDGKETVTVQNFLGVWAYLVGKVGPSKEPEYEYGTGEDGPVMGDVTMDAAGVPLLTIDARDGNVIQRIQAGWAASMGSKDIK